MHRPPPRLKTEVWVKAHIRRCQSLGMDAFLRHRGDMDSGGILLKINAFAKGAMLLEPITQMDGSRAWTRMTGTDFVENHLAEAMIDKKLARDRDLWVLEIEDPKAMHSLDEPII